MSMMSRLRIEARRAAACNFCSWSLAEKVELLEQELGVLAKSLRDDNFESEITIAPFIKRMTKMIIKKNCVQSLNYKG